MVPGVGVQAPCVLAGNVIVAGRAVDRRQFRVVSDRILSGQIGVTVHAQEGPVNRILEDAGIHVQTLAVLVFLKRLITMTFQACFVVLPPGYSGHDQQQQQKQSCRSATQHPHIPRSKIT